MSRTARPRWPRKAFEAAIGAWPSAAFPLCVATAIISMVTLAGAPQGWSGAAVDRGSPSAALPQARGEPAEPIDGDARGRGDARCTTCGIVESVRRVDAGAGATPSYEFTVRMRDGSTRVSRTDGAANWRSGDRIMLIGGAPAARD